MENDWFAMYVRNNNFGCARLGMIVSKKKVPSAVTRNHIKRLIREVFRNNIPPQKALDVVILARQKISRENQQAGRKALTQLVQAI
jgi:ribonuclease P protein component